jgi:hypothetical protein
MDKFIKAQRERLKEIEIEREREMERLKEA